MTEQTQFENEKRTILVVEDDVSIRRLMRAILESKFHFRILEAENGKKGLSILNSETPILILSDVMMPEMNGVEFVKAIRSTERIKNIPIVICSAVGEKDVVYDLIQQGVTDYILKPISPFQLINKVNEYIKNINDKQTQIKIEK